MLLRNERRNMSSFKLELEYKTKTRSMSYQSIRELSVRVCVCPWITRVIALRLLRRHREQQHSQQSRTVHRAPVRPQIGSCTTSIELVCASVEQGRERRQWRLARLCLGALNILFTHRRISQSMGAQQARDAN